MSKTHLDRARRRALGLLSASALAAGLAAAVAPAQAVEGDGVQEVGKLTPTYEDGAYIVLLQEAAAADYRGGTNGIGRTAARGDAQFRGSSPAVRAYSRYLETEQRRTARSVEADVEQSYTIATNGFSARLTGEQAGSLAGDKRVRAVVPVEARSLDAYENTAEHLGLYSPKGAWSKGGGQADAGSGTVVGIIDSGIWPESESFAGEELNSQPKGPWRAQMDPLGNTRMGKADGGEFTGYCETGEEFELSDCSTKLIGARSYSTSFVEFVPEEDRSPNERISPRDGDGHGSHTASTAAGNIVEDVTVDGIEFGENTGMVPGAAIAAYKVCWEDNDPDTGGCYTDAILGAIDDGVRDGVDVLNFSISGAQNTVVDPVEIAFAGAAQAGVFVAASAGNSGPTASTVAHNSPWLTTVAAGSYVNFEGTVELGDGSTYLGAMIDGTGIPEQTALLDSVDASAGDDAEAAICGPDSLTEDAAGTIVVCLRGTYARVDKSAEVARVGGVGMIMVNPSENSLDADLHSVPTVHLPDTAQEAVYGYLDSTEEPTAALLPGNTSDEDSAPLPQVAGFSSRGPALANESDILKPDITAPGQSVLAAVAPPANSDRDYDLYSGTSMAAPHIAGLAALTASINPDWTPQMIQSAMMTTAKDTKNADGSDSSDAFAQGAGEVFPRKMLKPGAFVTSWPKQWYGLITDQGLDTGVAAVDPKDVNIPSMANSAVTGETMFKRSIEFAKKGKWALSGDVPGFEVDFGRNNLKANRVGAKRKVKVTFTATSDAVLNEWAQGSISLKNGNKLVEMPVALKPVSLAVPETVSGEGTDGSTDVTVTSGTTGDVDLTIAGLTESLFVESAVPVADYEAFCIPVDPESSLFRIDLDAADDTADLDVYAIPAAAGCTAGTGPLFQGATGSADEQIVIEDVVATYPGTEAMYVEVDGYASGDEGAPMEYRLDNYDVNPSATAGDVTFSPNPLPVVQNEESTFTASWTGLDEGARYLGIIGYGDTGLTSYLEVSTPEPSEG